MSEDNRTLILGIGSDFGDDQLGIIVARRLALRLPACRVHWLRSPLDIGDRLGEVDFLHVVDACLGMGPPGTIFRLAWASVALHTVRFCGTHDFDLVAALQLAERLFGLPPSVTIWCVEASHEEKDVPSSIGIPLSPLVASAVNTLVERIAIDVINQPTMTRRQARHA